MISMSYINQVKKYLIDFETEVAEAFKNNLVRGPSHHVRGNEEQLIKIFRGLKQEDYILNSVARDLSLEYMIEKKLIEIPDIITDDNPIFNGIKDQDWIFASYRNHYHLLLRGIPRERVKKDVLEGRSMHPLSIDYKIITSAIVPGQLPVAVGCALAIKLKNNHNHVWAFCGDMAAETGVFEESTKYAEGHSLPITFIIEDNGISCESPTKKTWGENKITRRHLRSNEIRYYYINSFPHQGTFGREAGF